MKKRVKIAQPTFYQNEPSVPTKQMTARPPVPSTALASKAPKEAPKHPGRMSGVAGFTGAKKLKVAQPKAPTTKTPPPSKGTQPPPPAKGPKPPPMKQAIKSKVPKTSKGL